ncbi:hypothetical protein NDU88_007739 [Pleurodeles waltl]|uniref:Uncharacterized protein n=1 Tax=Pleurodeles waltl TaxID=8319 RepID=A0AAV7RT95_PLEWA|nr:hypothetical protein NDU88_007739 [Pleurodeles waltl]
MGKRKCTGTAATPPPVTTINKMLERAVGIIAPEVALTERRLSLGAGANSSKGSLSPQAHSSAMTVEEAMDQTVLWAQTPGPCTDTLFADATRARPKIAIKNPINHKHLKQLRGCLQANTISTPDSQSEASKPVSGDNDVLPRKEAWSTPNWISDLMETYITRVKEVLVAELAPILTQLAVVEKRITELNLTENNLLISTVLAPGGLKSENIQYSAIQSTSDSQLVAKDIGCSSAAPIPDGHINQNCLKYTASVVPKPGGGLNSPRGRVGLTHP